MPVTDTMPNARQERKEKHIFLLRIVALVNVFYPDALFEAVVARNTWSTHSKWWWTRTWWRSCHCCEPTPPPSPPRLQASPRPCSYFWAEKGKQQKISSQVAKDLLRVYTWACASVLILGGSVLCTNTSWVCAIFPNGPVQESNPFNLHLWFSIQILQLSCSCGMRS